MRRDQAVELHEPLLRTLRRAHGVFLRRRTLEAASLGLSVLLPALLGALVLGLLLGPGRLSAWLVPLVAAAGIVGGVVRALRFALAHRLPFGAFLLSIEEKAGLARNELFNALQLGRSADSLPDPLAREIAHEVLRSGARTAATIPYGALARARPLKAPLLQASLAAACVAVLAALAPAGFVSTARFLAYPGRAPERPGALITVDPGDTVAERGSSVGVRARVTGVAGDPILFHRAGGGPWERMMMAPEGDGFSATLADLQAETEYAVGVREERSRTYRISLQEPLRATGYEKRLRFPSYTGLAPEKELSPHGSIAALVGSEVDLLVGTSRPDATGRLLFASGAVVDLDRAAEGVLSSTLRVRDPGAFHVELRGGAGRGGLWRSEAFQIDPIPDRMPSLYLLAPGEQIDLPPDLRVALEVDCVDDFGVTKLDLVYRRNEGSPTRLTIARWTGTTEARVPYPWNLEEIALAPGDRIGYRFELTDNDAVSGPKTAVSPEYLIRFPTVEEMYAQQETERKEGIVDLRESLDRQIELRKALEAISQEVRQDNTLEWEKKQEVEEFLKRQEEIVRKMEDLAQNLDRQLDRMQQGELFSPEIIQKIAQIQDLVRQIQSPEFHELMEKMRGALQSLDPDQVRAALEKMKLTQKDLEQGLDRTLRMLERLVAEEKLDELIQRADRLLEEQNRINQELGTSPEGRRPDSTSALSDAERRESMERQAAAEKELEELRRQMEDLKSIADRSHQQMAERLAGEQGQQSKKSLDAAQQEMQSGRQCMSGGNRRSALRAGRKAAGQIQSFSQQMRQMQSQVEMAFSEELARKLMALAGDLVDLSQRQEALVAEANRRNTRELALEQDRIARAADHVVDQVYEIARETPFVAPSQIRALGGVVNDLADATDAYERGERGSGSAVGKRAQITTDMVVAGLLQSAQNMCSGGSGSSSCQSPNPNGMSMMQVLSAQQQGLNQGTQDLLGEMQGARIPSDQGAGRLDQLAARQMAIRKGLEEAAQSLGDRGDVLGRLDELGREMEEVGKQMRERNLDERIIRRQERILSRLLTAQRSLRRQDFEEQRRSRTGVDPLDPASPSPIARGLSQREQIRRGILRGSQDPIPGDFRRLVEEYFRALTEGSR